MTDRFIPVGPVVGWGYLGAADPILREPLERGDRRDTLKALSTMHMAWAEAVEDDHRLLARWGNKIGSPSFDEAVSILERRREINEARVMTTMRRLTGTEHDLRLR